MRILDNHTVDGSIPDPIPGGEDMPVRRCVVLHFTAGASAASSVTAMKERGVSAHVVVDRDGTVRQCRPFNKKCAHAGNSRWQDPKTGKKYGTANSYAVGIEIANAGDEPGVIKWAKKNANATTVKARHRNGGPLVDWEVYPQAQLDAVFVLTKLLCQKYNLDDITGHDCIAPERKADPGPAFPMEDLREFCGFGRTLPKVHRV